MTVAFTFSRKISFSEMGSTSMFPAFNMRMCSMIESRLRLAIRDTVRPSSLHSLNTGKPKIAFIYWFGKDSLDMPVLVLDLIHGCVQDKLSAIDHQHVIGDLLHFGYLV